MKLNLIDKLLRYTAPTRALSRVVSRAKLDAATRAYEATEPSRLRRNREDARSPDQIGRLSIEALRGQARYLDENHDLGKSVLNTLVNSIVGDGVRTMPRLKDINGDLLTEQNKRIAQLWDEWQQAPEVTGQHEWVELQRLACRTWLRDGEFFGQHLLGNVPDLEHDTVVQYSVQLMEADYCPHGYTDDVNNIVNGIRKNRWGKPTGYFFYDNYPSELINSLNTSISAMFDPRSMQEIAATSVLHLKVVERLAQSRGLSIFASVFKRLDDLKDYEESERIAARIAAAFALAITKPFDADPGATVAPNWREMELAPGIIADSLQPGEKIEQIKNERPSNLLEAFRGSQLKAVAAGTQAGYSSIARDYDGSYSSQRQELIESHNAYTAARKLMVGRFHQPIYKNFIDMVRVQGLVDFTNVDPLTTYSAEHVGRGIPYIEPMREMMAEETAISIGTKSRAQSILEKGGDPEKVNDEIIRDKAFKEQNDLSFSTDQPAATPPAAGNDNAGAAVEPDADAENADESDNDTDANGRALEVIHIGKRGRRGQRGPAPAHRVKNGKLQFMQPNGDWGEPVDIKEVKADEA